ncbi:methyl-viologen-reducing hydrogenase [Striga asiatica]|uniref:Methyl-viologen-reducing hydrogenase n=1 Tax=Striga asiatica TaxID=4170 RepID=A0A5A7Q369_STRAF|nr:methyl-viologen-reducing hydrogenase [Striga asiatica]
MGNSPQSRKRGTARKAIDKISDPNGEGGTHNGERGATSQLPDVRRVSRRRTQLPSVQQIDTSTKPDNIQGDPMLDRTLVAPERVGDRTKRSEVVARTTSQPDSDDFVDDIPLSHLVEIAKSRHGTRHSTSLPLVHQSDTHTKPENTQEVSKRILDALEHIDVCPKRPKVGARITSQSDGDDFVDDVPIRCLAGITKPQNDKVVLSVRSVPRMFPTFRSWSNETLRARECAEITSRAFGRGFVDVDLKVLTDSCHDNKLDMKFDDVTAGVPDNRGVQIMLMLWIELAM